jgi:hypothetical protein
MGDRRLIGIAQFARQHQALVRQGDAVRRGVVMSARGCVGGNRPRVMPAERVILLGEQKFKGLTSGTRPTQNAGAAHVSDKLKKYS